MNLDYCTRVDPTTADQAMACSGLRTCWGSARWTHAQPTSRAHGTTARALPMSSNIIRTSVKMSRTKLHPRAVLHSNFIASTCHAGTNIMAG